MVTMLRQMSPWPSNSEYFGIIWVKLHIPSQAPLNNTKKVNIQRCSNISSISRAAHYSEKGRIISIVYKMILNNQKQICCVNYKQEGT
jgi:hypothetical protein